jgi:hypothetical protein
MRTLITALGLLSITLPALAAGKTTKPRIAVLEFTTGTIETSTDKPRITVLEVDDSQAASQPRISTLEFASSRDRDLARANAVPVKLVDRAGAVKCSFDISATAPLTDGLMVIRYMAAGSTALTDGLLLIRYAQVPQATDGLMILRYQVFLGNSSVPGYTYSGDDLTDAAGKVTTVVSEDGAPLGALELALAVANRDGYCR